MTFFCFFYYALKLFFQCQKCYNVQDSVVGKMERRHFLPLENFAFLRESFKNLNIIENLSIKDIVVSYFSYLLLFYSILYSCSLLTNLEF